MYQRSQFAPQRGGGQSRGGGQARAEPVTCEEMLRLLPSADGATAGEEGGAWYAIAGAQEALTQRPEYAYKKHDVTLQAPRAVAVAAAAEPAAAVRPKRAASGFVTKRMVEDLLESVLTDFDPLTSLYNAAMRRRAGEELRKALMEFGSSSEAHFHFGMTKTQAALSALSGAKHPDIWAIRDVLAFVLDRDDIALPEGTPSAPPGSAKVA